MGSSQRSSFFINRYPTLIAPEKALEIKAADWPVFSTGRV
jgi:hypothetical protein